MIKRFKYHRFVLAALLGSLVFALVDVVVPWSRGARGADMHSLAGVLAREVASLFTHAPSLVRVGSDRLELSYRLFLAADLILTSLFMLLLFWRLDPGARRSARRDTALILGQMAIAIVMRSALINVVAAQLAVLMPPRRGLAWLGAQVAMVLAAAIFLLMDQQPGLSDGDIKTVLIYLCFEQVVQVAAFGVAWLVAQERHARLALAASNAELRATQLLLGDTVRASERMRIARDLHDAVGHHLTALNLHLDLALRQEADKAAGSLHTSRELARALLAEVRTVVSAERERRRIDVRDALRALCAGIPEPSIRLTVRDDVDVDSPALAHTLFCCVQEAISNAVRHAAADELAIDVGLRDGQLHVSVVDNGRGSAGVREGNGIAGMRERVAQLGGMFKAGNRESRGYAVELTLPVTG